MDCVSAWPVVVNLPTTACLCCSQKWNRICSQPKSTRGGRWYACAQRNRPFLAGDSALWNRFLAQEVCCAGYGAAELESWMETFCQLARKELLVNVNGDELEHAVLDALTGLSKVFDASPSASSLKVLTDLMNGAWHSSSSSLPF